VYVPPHYASELAGGRHPLCHLTVVRGRRAGAGPACPVPCRPRLRLKGGRRAVAQRSKTLDPEVGTAGRPHAPTGLVVN